MLCTYLLLFTAGVVCSARAEISIKKLLYVEASVNDKDAVSRTGLSHILDELRKVVCLPGEECEVKKSSQETTYYPSRRPWNTTPYRPYYPTTRNPWNTIPYKAYYYSTRDPWFTSPIRPYYYPTRMPLYTRSYKSYYHTTSRYWNPTTYRPYNGTTSRNWYPTTYRPDRLNSTNSTLYDYVTGRGSNHSTNRPDNYSKESQLADTNYSDPHVDSRALKFFEEGEEGSLSDCSDLPQFSASGVYNISVGRRRIEVFCDMETDGGNWTVIQSRNISSSLAMNRSWIEYREGFGKLNQNYWLGNKHISDMTAMRLYSLRVDLISKTDESMFAKYELFGVEPEEGKFRLHVANYSGDADDGLSYHDRIPFSTYDVKNDAEYSRNCSVIYGGGWWYRGCYQSDLNAYEPRWLFKTLVATEMKIRPADF